MNSWDSIKKSTKIKKTVRKLLLSKNKLLCIYLLFYIIKQILRVLVKKLKKSNF